jgi:Tfp pilus assembly protein PilV
VVKRLRSQDGFGLLELLIAMVVLNVGLLAVVAAFDTSTVALRRSSRLSTAATLADAQMERYRALTYNAIYLDAAAVTGADAIYRGDPAFAAPTTAACGPSPQPVECTPARTVTGPDRASYRVDTYVQALPANPSRRSVKQVTVVVRDPLRGNATLTRQASLFDASTG